MAKNRIKRIQADDPAGEKGKLKSIGGSRSDDFNNVLVNQALQTLWTKHSDDDGVDRHACCVAESPERCLRCGGREGHGDALPPFGRESFGQAWLYSRCWSDWRNA